MQGQAKRWTTTRIRVHDFVLTPDASRLLAVGLELRNDKKEDSNSSESQSAPLAAIQKTNKPVQALKGLFLIFDMDSQRPETYVNPNLACKYLLLGVY